MEIIPAEYYSDIYIVAMLVFSIVAFSRYSKRVGCTYRPSQNGDGERGLLLALLVIIFIGTRPVSETFADMGAYYGLYERWWGEFEFDWHTTNIIYDNLMTYCASIHFSPTLYYVLIATIYFGCIYAACYRLFPRDKVVSFLVYLGAFSTFSYGTNGIKAGAAAAIFILAISYRNNLKVCFLLMAISYGFHHGMQLPIIAFIITLFCRDTKYYMLFWCLCLLMALLHVTSFQILFGSLTDEQGSGYLSSLDNIGGRGGLRLDFIVYSAMPVLMSWYFTIEKGVKSLLYDTLTCVYIFTNGIWMLCMYANFTNRIAYLSWLLYPIVLVYPILNEDWNGNRYKLFAKVAYAHLAFTTFMFIIYDL